MNNNGFSPSKLIFGHNLNLPNFLDNKLSAQEKATSSDVASHISTSHVAEKGLVASELRSKLKLAVHRNV